MPQKSEIECFSLSASFATSSESYVEELSVKWLEIRYHKKRMKTMAITLTARASSDDTVDDGVERHTINFTDVVDIQHKTDCLYTSLMTWLILDHCLRNSIFVRRKTFSHRNVEDMRLRTDLYIVTMHCLCLCSAWIRLFCIVNEHVAKIIKKKINSNFCTLYIHTYKCIFVETLNNF